MKMSLELLLKVLALEMVRTQRVKNSSATPSRKERKVANQTCLSSD